MNRVGVTNDVSTMQFGTYGAAPAPSTFYILREDGSYLLREDGSKFIRE